MRKDWFDGAIGNAANGWRRLDTDWKGVLVATVILVSVEVLGVDIPW